MPSINLRLTDEQHDMLVQEADALGRNLQKQIIFLLFGPAMRSESRAGEAAASTAPATEVLQQAISESSAPAQQSPIPRMTAPRGGVEIKTDFRPTREKKAARR